MKYWINRIILATSLLAGVYFIVDIKHVSAQSSIRGKAALRGYAAFGAVVCNPFVTVCQGPPTTITSAEIISGNPVQILPAQGANTTIMLVSLQLQYLPGNVGFSQNWISDVNLGSNLSFVCLNSDLAISTTNSQISGTVCQWASGPATPNSTLSIFNDNGPATGGNGSIVATPIYTVVQTQ